VQPEPPESPSEETESFLAAQPVDVPPAEPRPQISRARAAAEVLACSGYPTQLLVIAALTALGMQPATGGALSPAFVFVLSAADTVLLLGLIFLFLRGSDERARDVFLGQARWREELVFGLVLVPVIFMLVVAIQAAIRLVAPHLRNVEVSPFTPLLASPELVAGFVLLVLIAGGLREELQRAFLLHRFEQRLGGGSLGVVLTSVAFGLGHTVQGWDAAIITALMGAFWGALYLTRRSVVSTVTNHALFNVAQIALGYATLART
jgi:membrane protease YdiL (CAAX protease family)